MRLTRHKALWSCPRCGVEVLDVSAGFDPEFDHHHTKSVRRHLAVCPMDDRQGPFYDANMTAVEEWYAEGYDLMMATISETREHNA